MREFLMDHLRSLQAKQPAGASSQPAKRLSVRAFIQRTSYANIGHLIAFPLSTWCTLFACVLFLSIIASYACLPRLTITAIITVYFLTAALYMLGRIALFHIQLQRRLRLPRDQRASIQPWAFPGFDRLFSWLSFGLSGYLPHQNAPSEVLSIHLFRVGLWLQCYFVVVEVTDLKNYVEIADSDEVLIALAMFFFIVMCGFVILPGMLELYAFPPYLCEHEEDHLHEVFELFPEGYCPDDRLLRHAQNMDKMLEGVALFTRTRNFRSRLRLTCTAVDSTRKVAPDISDTVEA